jgi:hypothetical protein
LDDDPPHSRVPGELIAEGVRLVAESAHLCFEARALRHRSRFMSNKADHLKRHNNDVLTISRFRRYHADRMLQRCQQPLTLQPLEL